MGLFYKISDKEMLNIRNKIALVEGIPALYENGFIKTPFPTFWYGRNNIHDFDYMLCRLNGDYLEMINVYIARGDKSIRFVLNIFEPHPPITSLQELTQTDGLQYVLAPSALTEMRLRRDDYKWIPFITLCCFRKHKIGSYNSKRGLNRRISQLGKLIAKDMINIDSFIARWHELHVPPKVDWEGNIIEK